jgi:hypothetical protein
MIVCSEGPKSEYSRRDILWDGNLPCDLNHFDLLGLYALGFLVSKRSMQTSTYKTNELIIPLAANGHVMSDEINFTKPLCKKLLIGLLLQ